MAVISGGWTKFYKEYQEQFLVRHELQGVTMRVLTYIEANLGKQNLTPAVSVTAGSLGLQPSHTSRAYGDLVEAGALIKYQDGYHLDPRLMWEGSDDDKDEWYREMIKRDQHYPADSVGRNQPKSELVEWADAR